MVEASSLSLSTLLSVAAVLTGAENKTKQSPNITTILQSRLVHVHQTLGEGLDGVEDCTDLDELQYATAKNSLQLVELVQAILDPVVPDMSISEQTDPALGTRDLSQIRTLLSIIFKWAVRPLTAELELRNPGPSAFASGEAQIIDLTEKRPKYEDLPSLVLRLLHLIFAPGQSGKIRQTWITTSILNHHAVDMLTPCLILGWSPRPISDFADVSKDIKHLAARFVNILRPHEAITALGAILSSASSNRTPFNHVRIVCAHLLSNQLKRPDGVRGLCLAIFGEDTEDVEAAPLEKLEQIARVLRTVPSTTKPEAYFEFMVPHILELLLPGSSEQTPPSHKRAAAFALSRMVSPSFQHNAIASAVLLPLLHEPFLSSNHLGNTEFSPPPPAVSRWSLSPVDALKTLQAFLLHTDPSPVQVSALLTPIVPEIYSLLALHRSNKTTDPNVRESLNSLLSAWGRIVSSADVIDGLCSIVNGAGGDWEINMEGFTRSSKPPAGPSISLLAAAELESVPKDEINISANPFNLRPDPADFVGFLKSLDRKDVASEVFVRFLNEYRELKEAGSDPIRTLLHLQLILQVQSQLSASILSRPEHVLSFIKHALASETQRVSAHTRKSVQRKGLSLDDLRIVSQEDDDEGDSDDEDDAGGDEQVSDLNGGKDEMVVTSITLLLSILEGNSDISPSTTPDLHDILASLDALAVHASVAVRQLAREARLVLTARTASTSSSSSGTATRPAANTESAQETYQKALRLLQDPIIPVRAHGLQLLRDLVSGNAAPDLGAGRATRKRGLLDPALIPGILSIFLQSIQDEESYLFLNAVQGLAAMVDGYGRDVLRGLMDAYLHGTGIGRSSGSGGITMSTQELDARIRVGEALNVVVKRCGSALSLYVDMLVPPLLIILRSTHFPTTLRTSALSILAQCVGTHAPSLTAFTAGLADTCVELIQLESVAAKHSTETSKKHEVVSSEQEAVDNGGGDGAKAPPRAPEPTDVDPVTKNAKVASFRRSAINFLSQLLRAHIAIIYDSRRTSTTIPSVIMNIEGSRLQGGTVRNTEIPESVLKRARLVLEYVAATDEDGISQTMAREALNFVEQYQQACLGF